MYGTSIIITKEFILKNISQEEIFQFYLHHGIIRLEKKEYVNTLRGDKNPDCSYRYGDYGDLMFRDFAYGKSYSWIDVVKEFYVCDYQQALIHIAEDFKLIENGSIRENNHNRIISNSNYNSKRDNPKRDTIIKVKTVEWDEKNFQYWKDYGFKKETLDLFKIKSISHFWVNDYLFYCNHGYTYWHLFDTIHRRTILNLSVNKKYKWTKNTNDTHIQGYNLLPKNGDLLVLTKSYKDILVYYEESIPSIAPNSEGVPIKPEKIEEFKKRFKRVVLQIDANNQQALENSIKLSNLYNVPAIYLPEQLNKTSKDISGCRKDIGVENTGRLIKQLFNL